MPPQATGPGDANGGGRKRERPVTRREAGPGSGSRSARQSPTLNELYHVLSSSRRRAILRYLKENPGPVAVDTLASVLAREGRGSAPGDDPERLRMAFEHMEFPVLADAALVEFDRQRQSVERGEEFHQVTPYLNMFR